MSEMKQPVGNAAAAQRCPPHPGFIRGLCFLCGVEEEEEDTAGGARELAIGDGNEIKERGGDEAAAARCPAHPGFVRGLCSQERGAKEKDASGGGLAVGYKYIHGDPAPPQASGTTTTTAPIASSLAALLRERKLTLILDLVHTLLNSTGLHDFSPMVERIGFMPTTMDDPRTGLFRLDPYGILTKLRPFARGFLEQASAMFEMHVCTLAGRVYARAAVKLLDPGGVYFGGRIVSSAESTRRDMKNLDVVPGAGADAGAAVTVILDDSDSAWPGHQDNLILIDRYHYFASTCQKYGYAINSMAELGRDEREHDGSLAVALEVLKRVHRGFFDGGHCCSDVREVIREERRRVLRGCTVAFSRLSSLDSFAGMWTLAERLGAVCEVDVDERVTHVVAEDLGNQKARWARDNGKFLVSPECVGTSCGQQHGEKLAAAPLQAVAEDGL